MPRDNPFLIFDFIQRFLATVWNDFLVLLIIAFLSFSNLIVYTILKKKKSS